MADADTIDAGLFAIALSGSDDEAGAPRNRTAQTEEAFRAVRDSYRPKVENGEVSGAATPCHSPTPCLWQDCS